MCFHILVSFINVTLTYGIRAILNCVMLIEQIKTSKNLCSSCVFDDKSERFDIFSSVLDFLFFLLFADNLNANDFKSLCAKSKINNSNDNGSTFSNIMNNTNGNINFACHSDQSQLIQITSSSSLQISNLNDSTIKQLSKKTKHNSKYSRTNRKKHRKCR